MEDGRCKLGLGGRLQLVGLIELGSTIRGAARALSVSPATAHRWWHRWQQAGELERTSRACLHARPPLPKLCPWKLSTDAESRILQARRRTNLGPARLAGIVGYAARRSGRCSSEMAALSDDAAQHLPPRDAMSAQSPARCCTWTPSSWRASPSQDTGLTATALSNDGPRSGHDGSSSRTS
jgi:transposase-like protein